jgi:hypothetical protein
VQMKSDEVWVQTSDLRKIQGDLIGMRHRMLKVVSVIA